MEKPDLKNKKVMAIAIVLAFFVGLIIFGLINSGGSKEKARPDSIFSMGSSTSQPPHNSAVKQTTTVPQTTVPFSKDVMDSFYKLATTGSLDSSTAATYTSPRWEAILGGDASGGVPIGELDKAINSDLDETSFAVSRQTAIDVTRAAMTGEGSNKWPQFFSTGAAGRCVNFKVSHAGATSLPYPNDPRWILGYVMWKADCPQSDGTKNAVAQNTRIYFSVDNGALTPRHFSELPAS